MREPRATWWECEAELVHPDRVAAARRGLPQEDHLRAVADTFRLLSDPTRVRIVLALNVRDMCVCDLSALLRMSRSETLRHLRRLRAAGVVACSAGGDATYYRLVGPSVPRLVAKAISEAEEQGSDPGARRGTRS